MSKSVHELVAFLYPEQAEHVASRIEELCDRYREKLRAPATYKPGAIPLAASDSIMIAYGDSFHGPDGSPLSYLLRFLDEEAEGTVSGVHILPFSPYSSDDGFSVIDYREVNPDLGGWSEVEAIAEEFVLMVDLVLNHCSAKGPWFQAFLRDEEPYNRYFITVPADTDVSAVARPRAHPLLTPFETAAGTRHVWTTFSADQVDLDFANPEVLLEMLDIFLSYVERGARIVRLDAIAYLWKELGTSCLHHPKTHGVVKLMRAVVDELAPWVVIITETNVPHEQNLSYFGSGHDEAHMVYNFSLPPLTLDAFLRGDASRLTAWAQTLETGSPQTTFFNFLASHDGVGLLPTHGILSEAERDQLAAGVIGRGGRVSYKATPDGEIPYEMNINYLSAITLGSLPDVQRAQTFLAAQSIMLALAGVPGIYYHSLIGSENWQEGVEQTRHNRTINREKLDFDNLSGELNEPGSLRNLVFEGVKNMLRARASSKAFDPSAPQRVLSSDPRVFALLRMNGDERVLALVNVCDTEAEVSFTGGEIELGDERVFRELISGDMVVPTREHGNRVSLGLDPHEVLWLSYSA
ncbi:MAG: alpha-amylase family glycosyl hydrolase [Spirochaetota bacterium]